MVKIPVLPAVGMLMAECAQVGLMMVSKAAMSDGMSNIIFIFYSNALASLILLPSSLLFHRSERPSLTFSIIGGFFLLGLLGFLAQFFGYAGINLSSPTLGTALLNLIPGFTYILAITLRMEALNWRSSSSQAKSIGTIILILGAFIVTLYKGPSLLMTPSSSSNVSYTELLFQQPNWVLGGLLLTADCVAASAWLIVQASILKQYPAELIMVFFYCFFVAVLSAVFGLILERDLSAWSLKSKLRFSAVLYSGVFGSAFQVSVSTWCMHKTGPVFVSMFKPVGVVIAFAAGVIFFGDTFFFGRLLGSIIIVAGFYSVMWGKAKESQVEVDARITSSESSASKAPLLQNSVEGHSSSS
ncbi:WAT1-related protein At3g28050-like [Humulus lupulus]|uniref:WAT1-related protein At3g28050-like n=1 Tax=Humulus lupulus TaxID=3486 RepID=UPI002B403358|nr:WAT1-related protein At3g28050-like [Humulus lupulus]